MEGLLPNSPGASPSPGYLSLVSRLGCPSSTHGRGMPFPDCLLLFSRLECPGSMPGRSIPFPDCLLVFSRFDCPGSTPGRGILFPNCLLLFSRRAALATLLAEAFRSLTACCYSALCIYTQSSGTVTHLSHTHTRQPPPYNRFDFLILEQVLHIEGWVFFLFFLFIFLG